MRSLSALHPLLLLLGALAPACEETTPPAADSHLADLAHDAARDRGVDLVADMDLSGPTHLAQLASPAEFTLLAGKLKDVKHLLRVDGRQAPAPLTEECIFQNTRRFPYHINFLHHFPEFSQVDLEKYLDMVLRKTSRVWWGGVLAEAPAVTHPGTGLPGVMIYTVYQDAGPSEALTVAEYVEVDRRVKKCVPYAAPRLALLPESSEQLAQVKSLEAQLKAQQVYVVYSMK